MIFLPHFHGGTGVFMKKLLSFILAIVLALSCLVSCGNGISISIYSIRLANEVKNIFLQNKDVNSYTESVVYLTREGDTAFSYDLYYERAKDIYAMYNVCETIGDYRLYAYEGAVYTENQDGLCAVLLLGPTYQNYIDEYLTGNFPLDGETLNQQSSKREGTMTVAEYHSPLTPQRAAALSEFGVLQNDTIVSHYQIADEFIESISYSVLSQQRSYPIAMRSFAKSPDKKDVFASVSTLEADVSVDIIFVDSEDPGRHYTVPSSVYVGIETGTESYSFFYDRECTRPYSYGDAKVTEPLVIYAKKN